MLLQPFGFSSKFSEFGNILVMEWHYSTRPYYICNCSLEGLVIVHTPHSAVVVKNVIFVRKKTKGTGKVQEILPFVLRLL